MPRDFISDLAVLTARFSPASLGLAVSSADEVGAFTQLLQDLMIPIEAASKVRHAIGFELYQLVLEAYWPGLEDVSPPAPDLPADPVMRDLYQNVMLAEMYMICAGVLDFVSTMKAESVGRVKSVDAGAEAEFELQMRDAGFFDNVRLRYAQKAYAALRRAGYNPTTSFVERINIDRSRLLVVETTAARAWTQP